MNYEYIISKNVCQLRIELELLLLDTKNCNVLGVMKNG